MALQLKDKTYLKIDTKGNYTIYKNKTARNKEKKVSSQEIVNKYKEILENYHLDAELVYYAPDIIQEYMDWKSEYDNYLTALQYRDFKFEFPLMSKYFSNIKDSLPLIIKSGNISVPKNKSIEEIYAYIKQQEFFGPVDEIKDI